MHISDFLDAAGFAEMRRRLFGIEVLFVLVLVMKDFNFKLSLVIFLFNFFYFVYQNVSAFCCTLRWCSLTLVVGLLWRSCFFFPVTFGSMSLTWACYPRYGTMFFDCCFPWRWKFWLKTKDDTILIITLNLEWFLFVSCCSVG